MADFSRDIALGKPLDRDEVSIGNLEETERIAKSVEGVSYTVIVACPVAPIGIPGIVTGAGHITGETLGTIVQVAVPKRGIIISATYYDLDYEGTQVDLEIFNHSITQVADAATWTLSDIDVLYFITEVNFFVLDLHIASATSEVKNIGKAYVAPEGRLYIQAVCRATCDIATGSSPRFQLQIQSFDPTFKEV